MFSGTIRDNVTLFDDSPTDEAVVDALRRAGLAAVATGDIRRPLGPGGEGLSAGEEIVAYCRIGERSSHTWFVLTYLLGYGNVRNYDGSWTEWGNAVRAPIERP